MEGPIIHGEKAQTEADIEKNKEEKGESAKAHEHIGQVLLTAEASGSEKSQERSNEKNEKRIATLNRAELLTLSEKIMVDGTTLRQIYETHLIGERGLRRLVAEYLRAGDVKQSLRREILEHEIDFERDPAMRDIADTAIDALSETALASSKADFESMVERASSGLGDNPQAHSYKTKTLAKNPQDFRTNRRLLDVGMISIITILIVAIILILLMRH